MSPEIDFRGLIAQAAGIETVTDETRWQESRRYSTRQKDYMSTSGLIGRITFSGNFNPDEIGSDILTRDFTTKLKTVLQQFQEDDNFGSLIRPAISDVGNAVKSLKKKASVTKFFFTIPTDKFLKPSTRPTT